MGTEDDALRRVAVERVCSLNWFRVVGKQCMRFLRKPLEH